jgi:hypothetical protein
MTHKQSYLGDAALKSEISNFKSVGLLPSPMESMPHKLSRVQEESVSSLLKVIKGYSRLLKPKNKKNIFYVTKN